MANDGMIKYKDWFEINKNGGLAVSKAITATNIFEENGLAPMLDIVVRHVDGFEPDMSTGAGRAAFKKFLGSISKLSRKLDERGKDHVAVLKARPKKIDMKRKEMRDFLGGLKEKKGKPLAEWEAAEDERKQKIADKINLIIHSVPTHRNEVPRTSAEIKQDIKALENIIIDSTYGEKMDYAEKAKGETLDRAKWTLKTKEASEKQQAEIDRLTAIAEAEDKKKQEEKLRLEGEARARLKAEAAANLKIEEERLRSEKVTADKIAAEQKVRDEIAKKEAAEIALEIEKAEAEAARVALILEKEASRIREEEKAAAAVREEQRKVAIERQRKEEAEAAKIEELRVKAADHDNQAKKNSAAKMAFMRLGFEDGDAQRIVVAIVKGQIPHITINY